MTGEFGTDLEGGYVLIPIDVPAGTTQVRVKYCHDQPEAPTNSQVKHTLDLGLYEARRSAGAVWGEPEFRGWGGSSHPDTTITAQGFSEEAQRRRHVPGRTTRGFVPGPMPPGQWAAELGVAAVASEQEGDEDGKVAWRVEIELRSDPAFDDEPYEPAPYDSTPARAQPGWYAGDVHVHAEHSSLGDATMKETFDYAFGAPPNGAGLDFITLSDYVTPSGWGEIGRHQARYPGKLVVRSSEVITYRGHTNNHASLRYVDYRTGPIYERRPNGALTLWTASRTPQHIFDRVHAAGGWTQVNHPTIFPSEVPLFSLLCRGCPWDYADSETDWRKVDSYEVQTGPAGAPAPPGNEPGPNPFTPSAIAEWDRLRTEGYRVTGVGASDSHNAGRTPGGVTQSPIGEGSTVVFAPELSERGIREGILAGHAYVRMFGHESPDLRLTGRAGDRTAIMGDRLGGDSATFEAQVIGGVASATPRELIVLHDGTPILTVPVVAPPGQPFTFSFPSVGQGDYRIQVMRGTAIDALSNPITLGPREEPKPPPGAPPGQGPGPGPPPAN
ncbi:MAG: CehA/McbA family metallohydrolase, partial [Actinomycetota bacterium]|nr:CehA/McbA family metallohydrolase [Actinomycetota bacterium]